MTDDLVDSIKAALAEAGFSLLGGEGVRVEGQLRNGALVSMTLVAPSGFPYELPEFKLDKNMLSDYGRLPHVGPTGLVCAFDRETNTPNPSNPEGQVVMVLERTLDILSDGVEGKNKGDYLDEFLAYWSYGQDAMLPIYSLVEELDDEPRLLSVYASELGSKHIFICKNVDEALSLAQRVGDCKTETDILKCLYLPLADPIEYPFPETHREWFDAIKSDAKNHELYEKFIQSSDRQRSVIAFSCPYPDGRRVFAAFGHTGLPSVKGFRKGKTPLQIALSKIGNDKVVRYEYVDMSQSRLFTRGGVGKVSSMKACVIGCGSIGSHLVDTLISCGVEEFVLVDNQKLSVENIARHLCGFSEIGETKVEAIKRRIVADNPNIRCDALYKNANTLIDNHPEEISASDYVFVTAGIYPLEAHIVDTALQLGLNTKIVLMWVEPYAIAGHALVLNSPQDVQAKMFDQSGRFLAAIVANPESLFKREAGCQSTYVPYSGLDVKSFLGDFIRSLMNGLLDGHNYHFAWYGAISRCGLYGATVSPAFAEKSDYCFEIQRID